MPTQKLLTAIIAATSIVVGVALFYISKHAIPYIYFTYIRVISATAFIGLAMFYYKRVGFSRDKWISNILILLCILFAGVFMFYKGRKIEWIQIDRMGGLLLFTPIFLLGKDVFGSINNKIDFEKLKSTIKSLIPIVVISFIIISIVIYSRKDNQTTFSSLNAENQIIELSPWENYSGTLWLNINKDKTFDIEEVKSTGDNYNVISKGFWEFDENLKTISLILNGKILHLQYSPHSTNAYLGSTPIENSILSTLWISPIIDTIDNNGVQEPEAPSF